MMKLVAISYFFVMGKKKENDEQCETAQKYNQYRNHSNLTEISYHTWNICLSGEVVSVLVSHGKGRCSESGQRCPSYPRC